MKTLRALLAAALFLAPLAPAPVFAAASTPLQQQVMCSPEPAVSAAGPRLVGGSLSAVPTGTLYSINGQGCTLVKLADVGYFQSQGYTAGPNTFSIQSTGALTSASSATSVQIGTLPAGGYITGIMLNEIAGAAITGGVDIGTASTGTQIVSAQALGANGLLAVADSAVVARVFGTTGTPNAVAIWATCHTSCNAGSVTITILWSYF